MPAHTGSADPNSDSSALRRITVNLTPRACEALDRAVKLTRDSKTDTINRALQVYAYVVNVTENGGELYVRDGGHEDLERLVMI